MKKLLFLLMLTFSIGIVAHAQDNQNNKDKVKKTSTIPQKVHNTFSKHKKHNGYKVKHKHNGITHKRKVNTEEGEVKDKIKK
jgi:CRISPR/Cas system CSM-associated protein Csm4 (group 5 of RAMP superfamily)